MFEPFASSLMCLAMMLYVEGRGEPLKGQIAIIQAVERRVRINAEFPDKKFFPGGTDFCAVATAPEWFGPGDHRLLYMNMNQNMLIELRRTIIRMYKYKIPWVAEGAPCFRRVSPAAIKKLKLVAGEMEGETKNSIVIGNHEFGWWCAYKMLNHG